MAPRRVTSDTSIPANTPVGPPGPPGSEKSGLGRPPVLVGRRHPPMLRMVLEALQAGEQRRGTSVAAIKVYILHKYPAVDAARFKYLLKQALATGMRRGLLARPLHSRAKGATGSFKLVPKYKKKIQPRKTATLKVPRRAREAPAKDPKKPNKAPKGSVNSDNAEKAPSRAAAAKQRVPRRGREAKDIEARQPSRKTAKVPGEPSSTNGISERSKVKGSRSRRGDAEAPGKTRSRSCKPAAQQVKNGVAFPAKRKMAAKTPKVTAAHGAGGRPRAKAAAAPPKGDGSKAIPASQARKMEAPEGPRRPGLPSKSSSSKEPSKKLEAGS